MPLTTPLARRLGLVHPIVQAPMAGSDTAALVAASSNAGALGCIGAAYLAPDQIAERVRAVRALTDRPFGINLFAPTPRPDPAPESEAAVARLAPFFAELGLAAPALPPLPEDRFDAQLAAVLDSGAAAFSFTFGLVPAEAIAAAKRRAMLVVGTATTVEEAVALERAGVDAVVAQGSEAGGHRGSFLVDFARGAIGTIALVPQMADAVSVPVVASGGIMDGRGIAAALALGADAVQLGTAFLACDEAGVPDGYKQRLLRAREDETRLTRAFSGRPARGLPNRVMDAIDREPAAILPFPLQNALTRPMRSAAAARNDAEYLSLWAGQGVRLARRGSASELVARLAREAEETIARCARSDPCR